MVSSPICGIYLDLDKQNCAVTFLNLSNQSTPVMSRRIFHAKIFKPPFEVSYVFKFVFNVGW